MGRHLEYNHIDQYKGIYPMQSKDKKKIILLSVITLTTVILGVIAVVTAMRLRQLATVPVAPTAPLSQPEAAPIPGTYCSQEFTILANACGGWCQVDDDCEGDYVCAVSDEGIGMCSLQENVDVCAEAMDIGACCEVQPTPTPEATPTPEPNQCGYTPCNTDVDCEGDLICIPGEGGIDICGMPEYQDTCQVNPSFETCCEAPPTPTQAPTSTPVPTSPPAPTSTPAPSPTVPAGCNQTCTADTDCSEGLTCYEGACRNPSCETVTDCICPAPTPTPAPALPEAGTTTPTYMLLAVGLAIVILGGLGLLAF